MNDLTFPCSVGQIVRHFGEDRFRVDYAIWSRRIKPIGKIGNANVYSRAAVRRIGNALQEIRSRAEIRLAAELRRDLAVA